MIFPNPVRDKADNSQWRKGQVDDAGIEASGRLFAELLGRFGTDGALGRYFCREGR